VVFQWSAALAIASFSLLLRYVPGQLPYCTVYVTHPRTAVVSICAITALEIGTLGLFAALLHINQRKRTNEFVNNALHTLTERYQLQVLLVWVTRGSRNIGDRSDRDETASFFTN
jgi:hypothetical protein